MSKCGTGKTYNIMILTEFIMKKFVSLLIFAALLLSLSVTVFAARKITDEEKALLANMKGKEILGYKISGSEISSLENFLMGTDRPLTQADIDNIMANMDQIINIILQSGATDLKNLPKDVIDKIMKIANSAASTAGLSVSLSSSSDLASAVTITSRDGSRPVIAPKEKIIKATGGSYVSKPDGFSSLALTLLAALFGLTVVAYRKSVKSPRNIRC